MGSSTLLKLVKSDTLWIAVGSIATAAMTISTWLTLRKYQKRENQIEYREVVESIIQPVIEKLESLVSYLEQDFLHFNWSFEWKQIKNKNQYLVSLIPTKLYYRIQDFDLQFHQFNGYAETVRPKLRKIIADQIRKIPGVSASSSDKDIAEQSRLQFELSGKRIFVYLPRLILSEMTLDEFKTQKLKDPEVVVKKITNEEFVTPGTGSRTKEHFEAVLMDVRQTINQDQELLEFLKLWRSVYESNKSLRLGLDKLVSDGKLS